MAFKLIRAFERPLPRKSGDYKIPRFEMGPTGGYSYMTKQLVRRSVFDKSFDNALSDAFSSFGDFFNWESGIADFRPRANESGTVRTAVTTTENGYRVDIEAPGMKKNDFNLKIEGNTLTVSSHIEKSDENSVFKRSFVRSWDLHPEIPHDKIEARYEDGILRIDIPSKKPAPAPPAKTIEIK